MRTLPALVPALALFATLTLPAHAQPREHPDSIRAYAAGYKAAFTCSAFFNAGKSLDRIAAEELTGIYPLIADQIADLPAAVVDRTNARVSVAYAEDMPPRISQWRPHLGCSQLPVGAGSGAALFLPRIDGLTVPDAQADDGAPWQRRAPVNGSTGNAALDETVAGAFEGRYGRDAVTSAIMIADKSAILAERYGPGFSPTTSQRTWSVAKSIAATVIGAAVHQGLIDPEAPAPVPEWQSPGDPRRRISLADLLHMGSGLDSNRAGNRTDRLYMGGGRVTDTATETALEARPGRRWKYANNDTLLAVRALRSQFPSDKAGLRFPFEALLYPIGMTHTKLETDWAGQFILSSQVWTTARDLARLGLLHLNDGVWDGTRILPAGWAAFVATPAPAQPQARRRDGTPAPGYGAQWWLYDARFPGLPDGVYAARGNRGQSLMLVPSEELIIVRRGYDPAGGEGFQLAAFARDILAALATGKEQKQ